MNASSHEGGRATGPDPRASVILACEMIEDEVRLALERAADPAWAEAPLVWIESGLHEVPRRLRDHLQGLVDRLDEGAAAGTPVDIASVVPGRGPAADRGATVTVPPVRHILLALGYCGNGLEGLVSQQCVLAFPRVDDCISLFLNHGCVREDIERDARAFYLTGGWLSHDNPVQESYDCYRERFGVERARELTRLSMASYERVTLIDTGAYEVGEYRPRSEEFATDLGLHHTLVPGSVQLLERLFTGPWDGEIVALPPGEAITIWHLFEQRGSGGRPE